VDALVTTRHGVMGVNVNWPGRENDAGYQFPWDPAQPSDNAIFLLRGARWERLSKGQPSPQNLFEMTSKAYDSKRDQVVLHGGGKRRDELWVFDIKTLAWRNMQAKVASPAGTNPPGCTRESVYIPAEDVVLIIGDGGRTWEYSPAENAWRQVDLGVSGGEDLLRTTVQNRAVVCALLNYGLLHEDLFFETSGEFFGVWDRVKPRARYVYGWRVPRGQQSDSAADWSTGRWQDDPGPKAQQEIRNTLDSHGGSAQERCRLGQDGKQEDPQGRSRKRRTRQ